MPSQIGDTCYHDKIVFAVIGTDGSPLLLPELLNLKTGGMSTAWMRTYVANYVIEAGALFLARFQINLAKGKSFTADSETLTELFGKSPVAHPVWGMVYEGFRHSMDTHGGILIAEGFLRLVYKRRAWEPPWKFRHVREVIFRSGQVVAEHDRSGSMANVRAKLGRHFGTHSAELGWEQANEVSAWANQCFTREYWANEPALHG